ncbi:MAG TPA: ThuA domain-containing protein, partial [Segetibacter sp.]|nr:ThuA domain-containing protein [Segetibacter sp.]
MKKPILFIVLSCICLEINFSQNTFASTPVVLVFTKTKGYRHASIPSGVAAIIKLGKENNFSVESTSDAGYFIKERLKKYAAVIFLSTTGEVLNKNQQVAFERYIRAGGGFVGIHSATDTEYDWPWYNKLVGAYFANHPKLQTATIKVIDKNHPSTFFLPDKWKRFDEWYNFKSVQRGIKILTRLDETTYTGGTMGGNHPFAWYHHFDGGRAFYTAGGHTKESYSDGLFLRHLLGGIVYAMGKNASPVIKITNPANNAVYYAPATINIKAFASDSDGSIYNVKFYNNSTLLKTDSTRPYSFTWSKVPSGKYLLTAKAMDNQGFVTTSATVKISVLPNKPPVVKITAPVNNAVYTAPANIHIAATASDADGAIKSVKFYNGTTLLKTDIVSP